MQHREIDGLNKKTICSGCAGESYLSNEIEQKGRKRVCSYCGEKGKSFKLDEFAERIEQAFDDHYTRTAENPDAIQWMMIKDKESDYEFEREGQRTADAIMNAADIPDEAASDVQAILADKHGDFEMDKMGEETPFAEDAYYEEIMPGDADWQESWRSFERTIKSEARFFSRTAAGQLSALFDDIDELRTHDKKSLIVNAGPRKKLKYLYRARAFQSEERLETALMRPDRELAAPPSSLAAAGRMNAKGISAFYGATEPHIALAEVRPPVGSQVAIGRFEIVRPLRLLDLNKLKNIRVTGSIFDPGYARRLGRMMFLRKLTDRLSRAVMPDDQDFEYLATQAIADYLATEGRVPLDGIVFPSVQAGNKGVNVVLFHKASRTAELDLPKGTEIEAHTWQDYSDGPEREYRVIERVPPPEPEKSPKKGPLDITDFDWGNFEEIYRDYDARPVTLKIDPDEVTVHIVEAVRFETEDHKVRRYRWEKKDDKDLPF